MMILKACGRASRREILLELIKQGNLSEALIEDQLNKQRAAGKVHIFGVNCVHSNWTDEGNALSTRLKYYPDRKTFH